MYKHSSGFTLIELMVVIVVLTIMLAIAAPAFSDMVTASRFSSTAMQLKADLNQARSESIKRNVRVLICPRNADGDDCVQTLNWVDGWLICADTDKDWKCDAATADVHSPILVRGALKSPLALSSSLALSASYKGGIPFNANGTQGAGGPIDLVLTRLPNASKRTVSIANTGNITSK